jgi:hypothetical protein
MTTALHPSRPAASLLDPALLRGALRDAFIKLNPAARNPVMFVVYVCAALITALWLQTLFGHGEAATWFIGANALWLWFTVLFANFAEAMAEGRSKAQAASLRSLQKRGTAKKLRAPRHGERWDAIDTSALRIGDVRAGRGRRHHAVRRRGDRRRCLGGRKRHHRRIGAGHPRSGRRLLARSPAARACCPTGSSCASRSIPARPSSTA